MIRTPKPNNHEAPWPMYPEARKAKLKQWENENTDPEKVKARQEQRKQKLAAAAEQQRRSLPHHPKKRS